MLNNKDLPIATIYLYPHFIILQIYFVKEKKKEEIETVKSFYLEEKLIKILTKHSKNMRLQLNKFIFEFRDKNEKHKIYIPMNIFKENYDSPSIFFKRRNTTEMNKHFAKNQS